MSKHKQILTAATLAALAELDGIDSVAQLCRSRHHREAVPLMLWVRAAAPRPEVEPGQAWRAVGKRGVKARRDRAAEQAWHEAEAEAEAFT